MIPDQKKHQFRTSAVSRFSAAFRGRRFGIQRRYDLVIPPFFHSFLCFCFVSMFFTLCIRREKRAAGNGKPRRRPKRRCRGKARTPAKAEGGAFPRNSAERSLKAEKRNRPRRPKRAATAPKAPEQNGERFARQPRKRRSPKKFCSEKTAL